MKVLVKAQYGSVSLLKAWCINCKQYAFVLEGVLQCCNSMIEDNFDKEVVKRELEGASKRPVFPAKFKRQILITQDNKCIYCGEKFGDYVWNSKKYKFVKLRIHFDHFIAWGYSRNNQKTNVVASCQVCNLLKTTNHYKSLTVARKAINEKRKEKGYFCPLS